METQNVDFNDLLFFFSCLFWFSILTSHWEWYGKGMVTNPFCDCPWILAQVWRCLCPALPVREDFQDVPVVAWAKEMQLFFQWILPVMFISVQCYPAQLPNLYVFHSPPSQHQNEFMPSCQISTLYSSHLTASPCGRLSIPNDRKVVYS